MPQTTAFDLIGTGSGTAADGARLYRRGSNVGFNFADAAGPGNWILSVSIEGHLYTQFNFDIRALFVPEEEYEPVPVDPNGPKFDPAPLMKCDYRSMAEWGKAALICSVTPQPEQRLQCVLDDVAYNTAAYYRFAVEKEPNENDYQHLYFATSKELNDTFAEIELLVDYYVLP